MSDERPPEILGSLPNSRPHRRSNKRGAPKTSANGDATPPARRKAPPAGRKTPATPPRKPRTESIRQPKQPVGNPPAPPSRRPAPVSGAELAGTIVQAAAELAEIGLSVSARTLRNALARLPRP